MSLETEFRSEPDSDEVAMRIVRQMNPPRSRVGHHRWHRMRQNPETRTHHRIAVEHAIFAAQRRQQFGQVLHSLQTEPDPGIRDDGIAA